MIGRAVLMATALAAALAAASCGKPAEQKADAGAAAPEQSNGAVNAVQDAAGAATGAVTGVAVGFDTESFTKEAAIAGQYEIDAAKLAIGRTKNPQVKKLATMLVEDHTAAAAKLKGLVAGGKVPGPLPAALDERRKGLIDNLKGAADADFDQVYLSQQKAAHQEAVSAFKGYGERGDNPALKAFASETAPKLQHHEEAVEALQSVLNGT